MNKTLCATLSGEQQSNSPGIWHTEVSFFYGKKHLKSSRDDQGESLVGLIDSHSRSVRIRFQHDERNQGAYAGRVSFELDSREAFWLAAKLSKAVRAVQKDYDRPTRERLIEALKATTVEYVPDRYQCYRIVAQPGDTPLVVLARQAS